MTYHKPANMKYTDLAIYVDSEIYSDNCDEDKCFQYLYLLFYMIAYKSKYFNNSKDYDEYALYGASQLFLRYRNNKQFDTEGKSLPKIKSCLNYIKRIAYPLRVNYQKSTFAQQFTSDQMADHNLYELTAKEVGKAKSINNGLMRVDLEFYLSKIASTVHQYLQTLPYTKQPDILHRIEISCLLTLLKAVTLNNNNRQRLESRLRRNLPVEDLLISIYEEEAQEVPTLWHLDKNMSNYIAVLVNKLKKLIAKDLYSIIGSYEPSEQVIQGILASPITDRREEYNGSH